MRCLWLTRRYPFPPHAGDLLYSANLIRAFAAAGAEVAVLCGGASACEHRRDGAEWRIVPVGNHSLMGYATSRLPRSAFVLARSGLAGVLRSLLAERRWDAVIIDHAVMGWCAAELPGATRLVYVAHNHEASLRPAVAGEAKGSLIARPFVRGDAARYKTLERRLVARADLVTAITETDAARFRTGTAPPVLVLPPGYDGPRFPDRRIESETPRRVVLLGSFDWIAKRSNLREFLAAAAPVLARASVGLEIVGSGAEGVARDHAGCPIVRFAGRVESVSPHLLNARIGVVAERLGGGFKLKALDYVFHGLPVAALDGVLAGLPLDPDAVILARDAATLAARIAGAIDDLAYLNRLREAAFARCRDAFDWPQRGRALHAAIAALGAAGSTHRKSY